MWLQWAPAVKARWWWQGKRVHKVERKGRGGRGWAHLEPEYIYFAQVQVSCHPPCQARHIVSHLRYILSSAQDDHVYVSRRVEFGTASCYRCFRLSRPVLVVPSREEQQMQADHQLGVMTCQTGFSYASAQRRFLLKTCSSQSLKGS